MGQSAPAARLGVPFLAIPGLHKAIANIEMRRVQCIEAGDHIVAIGRVLRFAVNRDRDELPLLSVGLYLKGYKLLARHGVHRIAIVDA